jgi:hypothetical protein
MFDHAVRCHSVQRAAAARKVSPECKLPVGSSVHFLRIRGAQPVVARGQLPTLLACCGGDACVEALGRR